MSWWDEIAAAFDGFVRFVPMLKVLVAIVFGFIWSAALKIRNLKHLSNNDRRHHDSQTRSDLPVQWWQQHTTPMYVILLVTLLCELSTFRDELNADPNEQEHLFGGVVTNPSENMTRCMNMWNDTLTLDEAHGSLWVAQVASLAPIFATLTFLVNLVATFRHVRKAKPMNMWDQINRGATIWILQLPVVYSMTALFSVEKGLKQARLGGYDCTRHDTSSAFFIEAGLSFGDGYEAIALLLFADITMNVIENTVDKLVMDAQSVKGALKDIRNVVDTKMIDSLDKHERQHFQFVLGKKGEETPGANEKVMTRLGQMSEKLVHATWSLSTLGIQYFAFTCLVIAVPQILACQAKVWGFTHMYASLTAFSDNWSVTFKGCGLLGSCVAIHNMVSIESNFDEAFLHGFTAKLKFISVKIMVSIVFLQQMVLPGAFNLSVPRANVFDASLRIIEFTFISIFNLWAWPLEQDFYGMEAIDIEGMEDLQENLLADRDLGKMSVLLDACGQGSSRKGSQNSS